MSYERVTPCVKIDRKVAFNIASEASYVYILNGQKFIKNAKNVQIGEVLTILIFGIFHQFLSY